MKEINPEDLKIDTIWEGPGKSSKIRITYLPDGVSVEKEVSGSDSIKVAVEELKKELYEKINGK